MKKKKRPAIDARRRTPRGIPTARPTVREAEEESDDLDGVRVCEEVAPSDEMGEAEVDCVDDDVAAGVVVDLAALSVDVLVIVVATGKGGHKLPDASSTPRNSPGMKLNSLDGEQHDALPLPQQYVGSVPWEQARMPFGLDGSTIEAC